MMSPGSLPLLLVLNACSGCAALIYQLVMFQMLQLSIGSSPVSIGILLGTVTAGITLGSLAAPRIVSRKQHPLRVYASIQLGIGIIGIVVLGLIPYLPPLYARAAAAGNWEILLRGIIAAVGLLPPAALIGATLPVLAGWVDARDVVPRMAYVYSAHAAGAALGCLLAEFYILRLYDVAVAIYIAGVMNGVIAAVAFAVSRWMQTFTPLEVSRQDFRVNAADAANALSGFCVLWAGVVWSRLLSLVLGGSIYTFSIILAVLLFGMAIGSSLGAVLSRFSVRPRQDFGYCQMLLAAGIAWAAYAITQSLPHWPVDPTVSAAPSLTFQLDLSRCLWAILPAASLWGVSFPLALAIISSARQDLSHVAGRVYGGHAIGAAGGALVLAFVWGDSFGMQQAQQVMIALCGVAALLSMRNIAARFTAMLLAVVIAFTVPVLPSDAAAYGRFLSRNLALKDPETKAAFTPNVLYSSESGRSASVVVSALPSGYRNLHVSGRIESSNQPHDLRLQRMAGHIAALYHWDPKSVLVVGFGSGITVGTFGLYPGISRIVICEREPLIPQAGSRYFATESYDVARDPRVEVIYDDARHFMLTTTETFDIITSHPSHPWVKGAAALYTREYFELEKRHLNPGGVIAQWLPLHETSVEVVKSEMATFFQIFPDATIWGNDIDNGVGYDLTLIAKNGDPLVNLNQVYERLNRQDHRRVVDSLQSAGFHSVAELFATYSGRAPDLVRWLSDAEINRDRNLRLEYLAGLRLNYFQNRNIYGEILRHRRFPHNLFIGSDVVLQALRDMIPSP